MMFSASFPRNSVHLLNHRFLVLAVVAGFVPAAIAGAQESQAATASSWAQQDQGFQLQQRHPSLVDPELVKPKRPFHGVRYKANPRIGINPAYSADCSSPHLSYYGGAVISNVQVVVVYWNSNVNASIQTSIPAFYQGITNSTWFDMLSEYSTNVAPSGGGTPTDQSIGRGNYVGAYTIVPSHCATAATCTVTDAEIQTEIQTQITNGVLPPATYDANGNNNTLYATFFPPKVTVEGPDGAGNSCVGGGFCAYHNTGGTTSNPLAYAVLMDEFTSACNSGCGNGTDLENQESTASHEMAEAVTDEEVGLDLSENVEYPIAWYDENNYCGEIADICDSGNVYGVSTAQGTQYVQPLWSNALNSCVILGEHPAYALSNTAAPTAGVPFNFTLTAQNPSTGAGTDTAYAGTVHFTSNDSTATLPADFTFVPADQGTQTFSATLAAGTSQTITATDTVNSAISATLSLSVVGPTPAGLSSPTSGSILAGSNVPFSWTAGTDVTEYFLTLGNTGVGSNNLYNPGPTLSTSASVTGLPTDGETIYARLGSKINGVWQEADYTFTAASVPSALTSPANASVLSGPSVTFTWTGIGSKTEYFLTIGNKGVGSNNLYNPGATLSTSATVNGLPTDAEAIYVRLGSKINGAWQEIDYTFTAASVASSLTSPTPGTTLSGASATFTWTNIGSKAAYFLDLGTKGAGSSNLYNSGATESTSSSVTGLPTNGETIYARLGSKINGTWQSVDYTYTASSTPAAISSPTPETTLSGASVTFSWTAGSGPTEYFLTLGSNGVGSSNLYNPGATTALSANVTGLPTNGETIYARLGSKINGVWQSVDYTYVAAP